MDYINISNTSRLSKLRFTLEELEEMNRDMESIAELTDAFIMPHRRRHGSVSNIIRLRPDISLPQL